MRLKRMEGYIDKKGKFHRTGLKPALPRMTELVECPCHQKPMKIRVYDGQALSLVRECARQQELGVRWNEQN